MSALHEPVPGQLDILAELGVLRSRRNVGIQQRRGVALPAGAVSVARPSKFGNPFKRAPTPEARAVAVEQYRAYLAERPELLAAARAELTGHDLACYCPLGLAPCHRDALLEYLEQSERGAPRETRWSRGVPGPSGPPDSKMPDRRLSTTDHHRPGTPQRRP